MSDALVIATADATGSASYPIGETRRLRIVFTDPVGGTPVDPPNVTLRVLLPNGTSEDQTAVQDSAGHYYADIVLSMAGTWRWRFISTAPWPTVVEGDLECFDRWDPAHLHDFVSAKDLSDYLGRDVTEDDGALFAISGACQTVRTIAQQIFNRGTATYTLDGTGTDAMLLPQLPVNSVDTVMVNGSTVTDYTLNGNGILFRGIAGICSRSVWPMGRQNVEVTCDHGYEVVDIPEDVKMVALTLAARIIVQGVATDEQVGAARMTYAGPAMDLTVGEKAILHKYRPIR